MSKSGNSKRIGWVDAAKGLAILCVIVGHTLESGTFTRNIIFSFHIPLFFILSGYTFKPSSSWVECMYRTKRDAVRLLVPYVLSGFAIAAVKIFYRHLGAADVLKDTVQALIWASGTGDGVHEPIGVLWFLMSLFTARLIVNVITTLYKNDLEHRYPYIIAIISVLGFGIGMFDWNWLIFNFDVSMAASGFVLAGMEARRHEDFFRKYDGIIFPVCLIVWMFLMKQFGYIEMSGRWYPGLSLGVLEAFCGSYCVIRFIQALMFLKKPSDILSCFGRHSLLLMCIHAVEDSTFSFWMKLSSPAVGVFARLAADILIMIILSFLFEKAKAVIGKTGDV